MDGNYGQNQNWQDPNGQNQNWQDPNGQNQNWQDPNQNNYYSGNGYHYGTNEGYPNGNGYNNVPNQGYAGNNGYNSYAPNTYNGPIVVSNAIPQKSGGLAIGSLACGIISILFCWTFVSIVLGIVGAILGIVNIAQRNPNKGMAIVGIVLNVLGFLLSIVVLIVAAAIVQYF